MYIQTNGKTIPCTARRLGDGWEFTGAFDIAPEGVLALYADGGTELVQLDTEDWLRVVAGDGKLLLTNTPAPVEPDEETLTGQARGTRRAETSAAAEDAIVAGVDVELSDGETRHFSATLEDQINLGRLYDSCKLGAAGAPYHADGEACRVYPAADILAIGDALTAHKLYHTTYCNLLFQWLARCGTREEIAAVYYGAQLPDDLAETMTEVLGYGGTAG